MRKLIICIAIVVTFTVTAYAQTGSATNEGQQNPMTGCGCSKMQQMQSHGMMQGCQMMGQGMMGGMMGMSRDRARHHKPWFRYGVSLILRNADRLGLSDEQKKQLDDIRVRYSKEIVKQNAELEIEEIDLEALLNKSDFNLSGVKEALKKVESAKTQIKYLRIEAFVEAKKILTSEQKSDLKKLMEMRGNPRMKGMMDVPESEGEDKETLEEEEPGAEIHGH